MVGVDRRGMGVIGYVYLAECPDISDCVKIGYTTRSPALRVSQLQEEYGTSRPFTLYRSWKCKSPSMMEKLTHMEFKESHFYREMYFLDEHDIEDIAKDIEFTLMLFKTGL